VFFSRYIDGNYSLPYTLFFALWFGITEAMPRRSCMPVYFDLYLSSGLSLDFIPKHPSRVFRAVIDPVWNRPKMLQVMID